MTSDAVSRGKEEVRALRRESRPLYWSVALFSLFVNVLLLAGPIYMLQVYDRVLGSGSQETLVALTMLVVFSYAVMGLLDTIRARILTRIASRFQIAAESRVFHAALRQSARNPAVAEGVGIPHLDAICRCIASPAIPAAFDLPWTPMFFAVIFIFHPLLGALSLVGALALVAITFANQSLSKSNQLRADQSAGRAEGMAKQWQSEAGIVQAFSMQQAAFARWKSARDAYLSNQMRVADLSGCFSALTRSLRLALQSLVLGLAAWLVISQQMTPGGMIAASILLGRALAPVETLLNLWPVVQRGHQGWMQTVNLLGQYPPVAVSTALPKPKAYLHVNGMTVVPPGERRAVLRSLTFSLTPGEALGVIGPSGSGKSSLARVLTGSWPVVSGSVRLDGAALTQYGPEVLGHHIGYLPQRMQLFEGTIAQNIARFVAVADDERVIAAAKLADAHEMILALPDGYDTIVRGSTAHFSGGEVQRVGLARALYHDPVIVVLDEPNSNLDTAGSAALNGAIKRLKSQGKSVLIMAHRPAAIQECDLLLVLDGGNQAAFGPKAKVMASMVKNADAIRLPSVQQAGSA